MKLKLRFLFAFMLLYLASIAQKNSINLVVGDSSWFESYPDKSLLASTEVERIKTHLQFVIGRLDAKDPDLSLNIKKNRKECIDLLKNYVETGNYPKNTTYPTTRKPCFIDDYGTVCAVGYLLEKTAGREEAERINSLFKYDYIADMEDEGLLAWQQSSGLSMKELEMIQPTYDYTPPFEVFQDTETGKFGIKSRKGKIMVPARYQFLTLQGHDHYVHAMHNNKWGVIDKNGKVIVDIDHENRVRIIKYGPDYSYFLAEKGDRLILTDAYGKILNKFKDVQFQYLVNVSYFIMIKEGKYGVWNVEKGWIIPPEHNRLNYIGFGIEPKGFLEKGPNGYGMLNLDGDTVFPFEYESIEWKPYAWFAKKDGDGHIYSAKGILSALGSLQEVEPLKTYYSKNRVLGLQRGKWGLINIQSQTWLIPPLYDEISRFIDHWVVENNGLYGYYDMNGEVFFECDYQYIQRCNNNFLLKRNNKMGFVDFDKKPIIPLKADSVQLLCRTRSEFIIGVLNNNQWAFRLNNGQLIGGVKADSVFSISKVLVLKKGKNFYFGEWKDTAIIVNRNLSFQGFKRVYGYHYIYKQNNKYGVWYCKGGNWIQRGRVTQAVYDKIKLLRVQNHHLLLVEKDGKFGVLHLNGKLQVDITYKDYRILDNGAFYIKDEQGWLQFNRQLGLDRIDKIPEPGRINININKLVGDK